MIWILLPLLLLLSACAPAKTAPPTPAPCAAQPVGEVALPGGQFIMGEDPLRPEEGPPRTVSVGAFAIDRAEVTNGEFAAFVKATGYQTLAERQPDPRLYPGIDPAQLKPSAIVFKGAQADPKLANPGLWWQIVDGAQWRHPTGPGSLIVGQDRLPVVQIAYEDALAYAHWRGRDLPTEAEWEFAARGGLTDGRYEWGDAPSSQSRPKANYWQGIFPAVDTGADGYQAKPAPVGCFPANGYGLHDMAGNVWEWTKDIYKPGLTPTGRDPGIGEAFDPSEPQATLPKHVIKGGSYLCADDYCFRYRPSARQPGPPDTGSSHLGFRTVRRASSGGLHPG